MYGMIPYRRRESNLFSMLDDIERSFFNNSISGKEQFRCDISEKDGAYLLKAELPGFGKEDISVEVNDDMLTISASHSEENDETDDEGNYIRRERRFGTFSRSFSAEGIDTEHITADYTNGVLSLELPKARPEVGEARKIEIGSAGEPKKMSAKPHKSLKSKAAKAPKAAAKAAPKAAKPPKSEPHAAPPSA